MHSAIGVCLHCGNPALSGAEYCCNGCGIVHELIRKQSLERFYDIRGEAGVPAQETRGHLRDRRYLEPLMARIAAAEEGCRIDLDVQGLHCSACVWLIEEMFRRQKGAVRILINPTVGRAQMHVERTFDLGEFVASIERFGYLFGPPIKGDESPRSDLVFRMGLCIAFAMNSMLFSFAVYFGLSDPKLVSLFHLLNFGLATATVLVGGTVFFRAAVEALRRRVLHLDLPIAIGIALSYVGSTYAFFLRSGDGLFFDTVNVFTTLMLVGRFLQERVLDKNRRFLLASSGVDGLETRKIVDGRVEHARAMDIRAGDVLLLSPGDLCPTDVALSSAGSFSLDWINGESNPREFETKATVPAGAFYMGMEAISVVAAADFSSAGLTELLRAPALSSTDDARQTRWWQRVTKSYVLGVFFFAAVGFVFAWARTGDKLHALDVLISVLVITCPCAFGIAVPMGYELVQANLRRLGLYVRSSSLLDRAVSVTRVVFDKTGTLTSGALRLQDDSPLDALDQDSRHILWNLATRSLHPKSVAVRRALERHGLSFQPSLRVTEAAGRGLSAVIDSRTYRLGRPDWALSNGGEGDVAFTVDGAPLAILRTEEELRPDARTEIEALSKAGYEVWMLSGDAVVRAREMAEAAGILPERALGGLSPHDKADWLRAHDADNTLMIGDGINDSLAAEQAYCSGTPAIDRPFLPAKVDFYFTTPGLGPIGLLLRASQKLKRTVHWVLGVAILYNIITVALAYVGYMSPIMCAFFMPLSSLTAILVTTRSLSEGTSLWTHSTSKFS